MPTTRVNQIHHLRPLFLFLIYGRNSTDKIQLVVGGVCALCSAVCKHARNLPYGRNKNIIYPYLSAQIIFSCIFFTLKDQSCEHKFSNFSPNFISYRNKQWDSVTGKLLYFSDQNTMTFYIKSRIWLKQIQIRLAGCTVY